MPDTAIVSSLWSALVVGGAAVAAALVLAGPLALVLAVPLWLWLKPATLRVTRARWPGEAGRAAVSEYALLVAWQSGRRLLAQLRGLRRRPAGLEDYDGGSFHVSGIGVFHR